jgi:hypothetical protein
MSESELRLTPEELALLQKDIHELSTPGPIASPSLGPDGTSTPKELLDGVLRECIEAVRRKRESPGQ